MFVILAIATILLLIAKVIGVLTISWLIVFLPILCGIAVWVICILVSLAISATGLWLINR